METTTMEIAEFPQQQIVTTDCRLSNNGWDETFSKQRIAEHVIEHPHRSRATELARQESCINCLREKSWEGRRWDIVRVIEIVWVYKQRTINIRYIPDKVKLFVVWNTQTHYNILWIAGDSCGEQ
jgi:nuclear transport factor 2 (NTF2) superfamily protein